MKTVIEFEFSHKVDNAMNVGLSDDYISSCFFWLVLS